MKNSNIFLVIFFAFLCGCVNLRLDISDSDKAWLPYKTNEFYELREDVFLMKVDSGLEPERLALVPPSDSRRGSGFYSSPKSIQLYYENPEQTSQKSIGDSYYKIDVVGVVSSGTEFIPHKIMRNAGWNSPSNTKGGPD